MITKTTDNTAVIDKGYHWIPINADTPRGSKVQLINRDYGVAQYGVLDTHNKFGSPTGRHALLSKNDSIHLSDHF